MNIKEYLKKLGVEFREFKHKPVFTVEEAKKERTCENLRGVHSKNLFLKERKSRRFYLVVTPESKPLEIKKLEGVLGDKLKFANDGDLKEILGVTPGSVSPFGLINDKSRKAKVIIDREIWESEFVSFHPNVNTETLELPREGFHKYIGSLKNEISVLDL